MTSSHDPPEGEDPRAGETQWSQPPPYPPPSPYRQPSAQVLSIIGFVCGAVALLFVPILFGLAGIILGIVGHTRGEPLGKWAAGTAGVCMVIGVLLGILLSGFHP
ncbi:hypothetical protein [Nonomuraea jiangxiensis]|uniref:DUF4190 domain-containing protein n=1 Tax=Nonomuraea jiangxiensis TaxID=633440 RepID=A0A1G9DGL4_9ACTN|nr:hypothetical protein [Nonomuraea jiangxiensis]SDK63017.1 hypothetical protein SAMN05421869_117135 [Nonomuraea jiangxiensis]